MSPEVVDAIDVLRKKQILSPGQSSTLLRVARRDLVSVRFELRALLYAGVLLAVSGAGLFLKENQGRIGPVAIASLLAAAAAGCLLFVFRRSPPFSWSAGAESHVATDYLLLLAVLLIGSDLAYTESRFRFLGRDWPYHLLVLSVIALAAAYRFDSRVVLSLALSSFAAWRGLSTRLPLESLSGGRPGEVRANAIACAVLFLGAAFVSVRANRKDAEARVRAAWVRAERDSEVRQAARAWREAGFIDDAALSAIEETYSAVWPRPGRTWGVLLFFFVSCFVVGLLFSLGTAHALGLTAFLLAGGLAFAADHLRQSASTVGTAAGSAAAFWSVVCLVIGTAEAVHWKASVGTLVLFVGSLAWAAAAWRWGYPAFATFAAVFFFLLLARFPPGRALWLVLGAALAAACVPLLDRRALAPSHRRGAAAVLAVSLAAVYAAINLYALDHGLIETVSDAARSPAQLHAGAVRILSAIATGAFPLFILGWGIRTRRSLLLDAGIVGAALSLVTLRFYVHIAPLWAILSVAGAGLILLALGVHRWLARSPDRQAGGFTAEPLFEDKEAQQTLGAVGALSLTPEARVASPEPGKFSGGGGGFGGAGSSGTF